MSNAGKLKGKNDGISPDLPSEILKGGKKKMKQSVMADGGMKWFCNIDVMDEVKRPRQENLRLKDQIQSFIQRGWANETFASTEFHTISA